MKLNEPEIQQGKRRRPLAIGEAGKAILCPLPGLQEKERAKERGERERGVRERGCRKRGGEGKGEREGGVGWGARGRGRRG